MLYEEIFTFVVDVNSSIFLACYLLHKDNFFFLPVLYKKVKLHILSLSLFFSPHYAICYLQVTDLTQFFYYNTHTFYQCTWSCKCYFQGLSKSKVSSKNSVCKLGSGYRQVHINWFDLDKCNVCHMDEVQSPLFNPLEFLLVFTYLHVLLILFCISDFSIILLVNFFQGK